MKSADVLSALDVQSIRDQYSTGIITIKALAAQFGVDPGHIRFILNRGKK